MAKDAETAGKERLRPAIPLDVLVDQKT